MVLPVALEDSLKGYILQDLVQESQFVYIYKEFHLRKRTIEQVAALCNTSPLEVRINLYAADLLTGRTTLKDPPPVWFNETEVTLAQSILYNLTQPGAHLELPQDVRSYLQDLHAEAKVALNVGARTESFFCRIKRKLFA